MTFHFPSMVKTVFSMSGIVAIGRGISNFTSNKEFKEDAIKRFERGENDVKAINKHLEFSDTLRVSLEKQVLTLQLQNGEVLKRMDRLPVEFKSALDQHELSDINRHNDLKGDYDDLKKDNRQIIGILTNRNT